MSKRNGRHAASLYVGCVEWVSLLELGGHVMLVRICAGIGGSVSYLGRRTRDTFNSAGHIVRGSSRGGGVVGTVPG